MSRSVCYQCHRPEALCLCGRFPVVNNRTAIWILQHPRERFHPIGTARLARLGLQRAALHICYRPSDLPPARLPPGAAVLYPTDDGPDLASLAPSERPKSLIVIDGTWANARTLYRDNAWLHTLPHYRLTPAKPSSYRIRREPRADYLSTIEAIEAALQVLEPETPHLEHLLAAFDAMISAQIAVTATHHAGRRRRAKPKRSLGSLPRVLARNPERLVVVYGESCAHIDGRQRGDRSLAQWCAFRPASGELFSRVLEPARAVVNERHLQHMGIYREALASRCDRASLERAWQDFMRPDDVAVAWNQSSLDLLPGDAAQRSRALLLKGVYCNYRHTGSGTLEDVVAREALQPQAIDVHGRAQQRLAAAVALLQWLQKRSAPLAFEAPQSAAAESPPIDDGGGAEPRLATP